MTARPASRRFEEHRDGLSLVLLDLTMRGLGGVAVLSEIRSRRGELPVVLMSGFHRDTSPEADGADGFLDKPFTIPNLATVVASALT